MIFIILILLWKIFLIFWCGSLQDCSVRTISTTASCTEGTDTVDGIGRYAGQYWTLIGRAGPHVAGLCALIGCNIPGAGGHWLPLGVGAAVRLSGHTNTVTTPLSALLCSALYSLLSPHFNSLIWNNNSRFKGEAFNSLFWNGFIFYYFPLFIPGTTFK